MINYIQQELKTLKMKGLNRAMRNAISKTDTTICIDGKECINFSSNNYLGLARHPEVITAAIAALKTWGAGGTSSRLICGNMPIHRQLEKEIASFKKTEAALVFPSGYQANMGVLSSLFGSGDCIIMDRLNHASLWDGAKLSGARIFAYAHTDMHSLEKVLKRAKAYRKKVIVTDSLFSMDGDIAPLCDIVNLAELYGAAVMIDEAHATGVFGNNGAGLAEHFNLSSKIDIIMGTLSKAIGSQGAYICGSKSLVQYLINKSRSFIYTTALAPASAAAALKAIELIQAKPLLRQQLQNNAKHLREMLAGLGKNTAGSQSQIVPVIMGGTKEALKAARRLEKGNIFAPAIRPPTVPEGECRLRISLTAGHTMAQINTLIQSIASTKGATTHG
jgi:8-amino-7-oxononanoate synthase